MAVSHPIPEVRRFKDLTDMKFGRLTVLSYAGTIPHGKQGGVDHIWNCSCECGTQLTVRHFALSGKKPSRSCGCLQRDTATKHGLTLGCNRFLYDVHRQMMQRCFNADAPAFPDYGGRGIVVCNHWHSVVQFVNDVGEPPTRKHMLDRIDNNGNYSCGHCEDCIAHGWPANWRWATSKEQNRNRRDNRLITFNGETLCMAEWAARIGLTTMALWLRLERGWTEAKAVSTPKSARFQ